MTVPIIFGPLFAFVFVVLQETTVSMVMERDEGKISTKEMITRIIFVYIIYIAVLLLKGTGDLNSF